MRTAPRVTHLRSSGPTGAAVAGTGQAILQVVDAVDAGLRVRILQVKVLRSDGVSVTAIRPRIYEVAGAAAGALSEVWRAAATSPAGDLVNARDMEAYAEVDASGRLYLAVDGDALDTFAWVVWFQVV